ncbi:MAG TPA: ribosome maturation factor RimP [Acidimicrobiales bacterium]|nr:ribosome maturation factor RimP [Acidimicrobiales bacterium]
MATTDRVAAIVAPLADERGLDLYDVEQHQASLRVLVNREGGVDIDTLAELSRAVSRALDEVDPVAGKYTLEVSSPGLERPLRRPDHFAGAVGEQITVKTVPGTEGDRRVTGELVVADDDGITIRPEGDQDEDERRLGYDQVLAARTLFDWGTTTKPTTKKKSTR